MPNATPLASDTNLALGAAYLPVHKKVYLRRACLEAGNAFSHFCKTLSPEAQAALGKKLKEQAQLFASAQEVEANAPLGNARLDIARTKRPRARVHATYAPQ